MIVIDGIPQTSGNTAILDQQDDGSREATEPTLADINPQDIASIEVLNMGRINDQQGIQGKV